MNGVDLVVGPLPSWSVYVLLLLASGSFYASASNAYKAIWFWIHPIDQTSDASIREALKKMKAPPFGLYALAWGSFGILELAVAIMAGDMLR